MIRQAYKIILSVIVSFIVFFASASFGQSSFKPDSLQAILKSNVDNYEKLEALIGLTNAYLAWESYDSSILFCDSAISLAISIGDISQQAELNIIKGKALFYSKGPEKGIGPYKTSYSLFTNIGDSAGMASALNGIGVMYEKLGLNDSALSCYIQLVTIAEKMGYEKILGMGYVNMGILYQYLLDFEKAIYYLDLSIPLNKKYNTTFVALALMNKGLIFDTKEEYDSALLKYRQTLSIYNDLGNSSKKFADLYNNFGNLYIRSPDLDSAEYYYIKAKEIYLQLGDWYSFCQAYNNLALIAYYRGNYNQALLMFDSCLVMAKEKRNTKLESNVYINKHLAYTNKGNYRKALENYRLYDSVDQIIYSMEKEKVMADLEMKYQNEKIQAQILTLERDNLKKAKQKNIFLFTGIGLIAISIFIFLIFRQRAVKDKIIARQCIRQLEEEKKLLAAQYLVEGQEEERKRIAREIHDGLGVLLSTTRMQFSNIVIANPEAKPLIEKASKMLEQASSDARKISHNMMPGLLTKLGLYEAVGDLFEKLSETESLEEVYVNIPEELKKLPENKEIMIYRIIQEIVNNTLKHAGAKNINLSMQMQEDQLEIIYSDDGKGFNFEEKLKSKSLGLNSLRSRVNFLNGKMVVHSEPGKGVSFTFTVPC